MLDEFIEDQKIVYKILTNAGKKQKFSHAYLFETNGYEKKEQLVYAFAKYLLCSKHYTNTNNCVDCTQCENIDSNRFSEIKIIRPDGMWIKKEQLDRLQHDLMQTSVQTDKRVYIIFDADKMNSSASNSILKFLEEPEENIIAILVTDNVYQLLDTIRSRCQIISVSKSKINKNYSVEENIASIISHESNLELVEVTKYVQAIINFITFYDQKGLEILLNTQKFWHQIFNDREKIELALDIMILYYKDLLNYKMNQPLEYFKNDSFSTTTIEKQTIQSVIHKIKIISECKENSRNNLNNNLLIDSMIIQMKAGEEHE